MISVDVCDGRVTEGGLAPERIREFVVSGPVAARNGGRRRGSESNGAVRAGAAETERANGPGHVVWVDLQEPTADDWEVLNREFRFHPLALEDARKQDQRPKVDAYDGYLFVSVRVWASDVARAPDDDVNDVTREVDVFLGPNYIVTIHDEADGAVQETRRRLRDKPEYLRNEPGFLLYLLLDAIVDDYFPAMDALDAEIDKLEMAIYETAGPPDLKPAVALKKRLLLLRQAVSPLRDVLNQLLRTDDHSLIAPDLHVYYQDVYDHTLRLVEQVDLHRDILGGVVDVIMSQTSIHMADTSNRLNQVMKTLTGISTILMSAALISGIYGMNFKNMPELNWANGYYMALGLMVCVAGGLALYFRRIKWF